MAQATTNHLSKPVIVPGFGDKKSYHLHDIAYGRIVGIRDAIVYRKQGFSQTTVVLDPDKVAGLTDLEKLVLADGQPSPFGGVVTGNTVTIYRD
ncbi:hypothetical protein NMP99_02910 [Glutamicibacter mishrai]|uniref:hypothetical protein n=1 Tax=Glutamicibacter mishrai TaxID=1775880 RepID=UPI0020CF1162|nr:hypothetical protein [Glutamicibacter mishrai]UTT40226.1 hypothetical protein NMP99_02620 [Glutamicibacter mishrai]UTT40277.1 hypothetical protein NMP99_02910 [Glutamicibacter mishrai]